MISKNKRKTQLEIALTIWAEVKRFATLKGLSINAATEHLLERGLVDCGCSVKGEMAVSAGRSLVTTNQQTPAVVDIHW
jgi:hypothetical protein